jgi:hypothetical protein
VKISARDDPPPKLREVADHIERRMEGHRGRLVLHYVKGQLAKPEYDVARVGGHTLSELAPDIERTMHEQTGSVTIPYEDGRFGEPKYRTFEDARAMPRRSA